ncbi:MAG TPA: alpha/beta fold hydrolase [Acetobacteraceae bacterium]|nr:alpha/beta fold hydrolase [Acetobacteraceae bacterium]
MKLDIAHLPAHGPRRGTILFLHGAWSWLWYWQVYFMPWFAAQGYDAVAFSLRGHGASDGIELINTASIGDYVRDLRSVVATLDDPLIVGHSMGGFITQAYLARFPARGAVLLASAAPKPLYAQLFRLMLTQPGKMLRATLAQTVASGTSDTDNQRRQMFSRGPEDRSMDQYLPNIQAESYRAIASMLTRGLPHPERVTSPLLILGAGRDRLVPPDAVALTGKIYGKKPVMFDEMSHMMMLEPRWQAICETILEFDRSL